MPTKRHTPEEIVSKLRQVDVMMAQGQPIATAVKKIGVTEQGSGTNFSIARSSTACVKQRS
jgi:hypothetical protein